MSWQFIYIRYLSTPYVVGVFTSHCSNECSNIIYICFVINCDCDPSLYSVSSVVSSFESPQPDSATEQHSNLTRTCFGYNVDVYLWKPTCNATQRGGRMMSVAAINRQLHQHRGHRCGGQTAAAAAQAKVLDVRNLECREETGQPSAASSSVIVARAIIKNVCANSSSSSYEPLWRISFACLWPQNIWSNTTATTTTTRSNCTGVYRRGIHLSLHLRAYAFGGPKSACVSSCVHVGVLVGVSETQRNTLTCGKTSALSCHTGQKIRHGDWRATAATTTTIEQLSTHDRTREREKNAHVYRLQHTAGNGCVARVVFCCHMFRKHFTFMDFNNDCVVYVCLCLCVCARANSKYVLC